MYVAHRVRNAAVAGVVHLGFSLTVAAICAALVFLLWYPYPYNELVGGQDLFWIVIAVDVICGPLLTFVVFDLKKKKTDLYKDLAVVAVIQIIALVYGLVSVYNARPVFLAYEGRLFRVVTVPEVDIDNISRADTAFQKLSSTGPKLIGVTLSKGSEKDFIKSIQMSLEGLHPAFRPGRWTTYEKQTNDVLANAKELKSLAIKNTNSAELIDALVNDVKTPLENLIYLPLVSRFASDWIIVLSKDDAKPVGYIHIDGWE